jgi:acyl carrier protein
VPQSGMSLTPVGGLTEYNKRCNSAGSGCPTHYCCETVMSESNPTEPSQALQREVAGLIVTALNLDLSPEDIQPDAPLYGEGLGLDSIDILEVALVVSKQFGFSLRADSADNTRIFSSLAELTRHITANRTK